MTTPPTPHPRSVLVLRADTSIGRESIARFEAGGDLTHAVADAPLDAAARRRAIAGAGDGPDVLVVPPPSDAPAPAWPRADPRPGFDASIRTAFFWAQEAARSQTRGHLVMAAPPRDVDAAAGFPATLAEGAFVALVRLIAVELAPRGIAVNAVCPIAHDAEPASVAAALAFLASPDASYMTGAFVPVLGPSPSLASDI